MSTSGYSYLHHTPSVYKQQTIVPSEKLVTNPNYERILNKTTEEEEEQKASSETARKQQVLLQFQNWTNCFHRIQKCKLEMQKLKLQMKESESKLINSLRDQSTSLMVPVQERKRFHKRPLHEDENGGAAAAEMVGIRPAFLCVEEHEKKRAFSAKLLRDLLSKHLGEEKGNEVFHFLNENRVTDQKISTLKIRRKAPVGK